MNIRDFLVLNLIFFETLASLLGHHNGLRILRNIKTQTFIFTDLFLLQDGHIILRLLVHEKESILDVEWYLLLKTGMIIRFQAALGSSIPRHFRNRGFKVGSSSITELPNSCNIRLIHCLWESLHLGFITYATDLASRSCIISYVGLLKLNALWVLLKRRCNSLQRQNLLVCDLMM